MPAVAVLALLDAAILNLIVGNADAHGKNFSLLYSDGRVALAPFYDLLCTAAYPDLTARLAMKIGKRTLDEIGPSAWPAFAEDVGLGASFVRRRVKELSDAVVAQLPHLVRSAALDALDGPALERFAVLIRTRAERVVLTSAK
jgi:serine/threonine-protein kinase HipA